MENTIVTMKELITDLKDLRGKDVKIFGQPTTLDMYEDLENELLIDTIEVLEALEEYVVESIEVYNKCEHCDGSGVVDVKYDDEEEVQEECEHCDGMGYYYTDEAPQEVLNKMWENGELEDIESNNTYNWLSPLTNDLNWNIYKRTEYGDYYVELKAHRYGDIRGNYTSTVVLKFDDDTYKFYETIRECEKYVSVEIDGITYDANVNPFSDTLEIITKQGEYICEICADTIEELEKELKEYLS